MKPKCKFCNKKSYTDKRQAWKYCAIYFYTYGGNIPKAYWCKKSKSYHITTKYPLEKLNKTNKYFSRTFNNWFGVKIFKEKK